jgi:hypothetical protein
MQIDLSSHIIIGSARPPFAERSRDSSSRYAAFATELLVIFLLGRDDDLFIEPGGFIGPVRGVVSSLAQSSLIQRRRRLKLQPVTDAVVTDTVVTDSAPQTPTAAPRH